MKLLYACIPSLLLIMTLSCKDNPEAGRGPSVNWNNPSKSGKDKDFLSAAYSAGMMEIEVANHVKNILGSKTVKDLAVAMISAHSAMNERIKRLADEKKISLPEGLGQEQREKILKLDSEGGPSPDKAYTELLVEDHTAAVTLFEKAAKDAKDKNVKKFFSEKLSEIQHHLEMATAARSGLK
jgi:putative membrane protein